MRAYPALLEPLLFYVLHRVDDAHPRPDEAATLKLCVMDEAWRFIQHPTLRAYVQEALKTWRKRNAAMMLATQTVEDFASADLLRTVVESCPTKLLLANPALDRRQYAELFQLNEMELDLLTGLMPRQQMLLKRPDLAKVLTLAVDPKSYWIYTNTPIDNDAGRRGVSRVRLRGGPGPARGLGLNMGGVRMRARAWSARVDASVAVLASLAARSRGPDARASARCRRPTAA